ncbi:MAG: NADAR family protein [Bacillota bacterium]|jgi:ribA/ribD-fused uncharacterized protein|nr:NADAR family protein [Bacillota bacterium]NLL26472.1 NADAR family protein [Erysipelotrichia bacterium]
MRVVLFERIDEENGYLSVWYPCNFFVDGYKFWCVEQYLQYRKAVIFNDHYRAEKLLNATERKEVIQYGKGVNNYVDKVWNTRRHINLYKGNYAKFSQNQELKDLLLSTGDIVLAKCGKTDKVWGTGLNYGDTRLYNLSRWEGLNLHGFSLMEVRDTLKKEV